MRKLIMLIQLILHTLFLWPWVAHTTALAPIAKANCSEKCGNVTIPYPFGDRQGCYLDSMFQITCVRDPNRTYPILSLTDKEIMEISVQEGLIKVRNPITFSNCGESKDRNWTQYFGRTPFAYSSKNNVFSSIACGAVGLMTGTANDSVVGGCLTICGGNNNIPSGRDSGINFTAVNQSCNGVDCCQTTIPLNLQFYSISFLDIDRTDNPAMGLGDSCRYAFVADQKWFSSKLRNLSQVREMVEVPVVLEWGLYHPPADVFGETFRNVSGRFEQGYASCEVFERNSSSLMNGSRLECSCRHGFEGNPYLLQGCQDIDECSTLGTQICGNRRCVNYDGGFLCINGDIVTRPNLILIGIVSCLGGVLLLVGTWWSYKLIKKRKREQQKRKYFKRNGGLLLQQQISSSGEVNVENIIKLFNSKELEKATEKYNASRILGQGGQGTVYKGMLTDGKIVAVKRPKSTVEGDKLHEFINEVVILSQINHRNVVKLFGCCLETEVPLLVYEFVPNGTLSQYIHDANDEFPLTWETRLRIASETAGALAYLHSSASVPIYHRDIKSANILLDEKYRAKVADFGTSRSISLDQTHLTTMVYGTFGYLDPEYFQSGQFTEKSDVYSFGVVLAELLTGQKPIISMTKSEIRGGSLATCFMDSVEEDRLFEMVDARVVKEAEKEAIIAVASLAKKCLNLNGKRRPTMKEVASFLEDMRKPAKSGNAEPNEVDEFTTRNGLLSEPWDTVSASTWSTSYDGASSVSASHPLLSFK